MHQSHLSRFRRRETFSCPQYGSVSRNVRRPTPVGVLKGNAPWLCRPRLPPPERCRCVALRVPNTFGFLKVMFLCILALGSSEQAENAEHGRLHLPCLVIAPSALPRSCDSEPWHESYPLIGTLTLFLDRDKIGWYEVLHRMMCLFNPSGEYSVHGLT